MPEASELDPPGGRSRAHLPLRLVCVAADDAQSDVSEEHLFGEIHFGTRSSKADAHESDGILVQVPLSQLGGAPIKERWLSPSRVEGGRLGNIHYRANGEVLFASAAFELPASGAMLERETQQQYESVLGLIKSHGYPYLLRVWNYLPRIGQPLQGMDCYRRFCRARYYAFVGSFEDMIPQLPATSVLGTAGEQLQTVVLAGKRRPLHIENPRQVSAYRYPRKYGPKSPLFARATLARWGARNTLFISGTASIVGHESRHPDDPAAQTEEILRNLDVLNDEVSKQAHAPIPGVERARQLRVYMRNPRDLTLVRRSVEARTAVDAPVVYLHADICRPELLVEMEALIDLEASSSADSAG